MLTPDELNEVDPEIRKLILDRTKYSMNDSNGLRFYSPNCDAILQSWMNHSNNPNTTGTKTLRDIKKGEELTENYNTLGEGEIHPISLKHFGFLQNQPLTNTSSSYSNVRNKNGKTRRVNHRK